VNDEQTWPSTNCACNERSPQAVGAAPQILQSFLSPNAHLSLAFSCADKLLWFFAEQIFEEKELAIAYPCLGCRGGLTLFLAYLILCVHSDTPGKPFNPVLVYPGTTEIRESYKALRIRVGDLLKGLQQARVMAGLKGGIPCVYTWEEKLFSRVQKGKIARSDEYPLHDFFPAAVLDGDCVPRLLGGRHGFGRGDDSIPPLHFAVRIDNVSPEERYRAAFLMHDALTTHAERRRLNDNIHRVSSASVIHLFESPFSPNFRKLVKKGAKCWRIRPSDFPADGELFLEDQEVLLMMDSEPRVHRLPSPLSEQDLRVLYENFGHLRQSARNDRAVGEIYRRLYNLYRFVLTLPVPVEDYDSVAMDFGYATVKERFEDIKEEVPNLGAMDYAHFDDSLQKILSMEERLREDPARSRAILTEVRRAGEKNHRIGIVISNELYGLAIQRFLARSLTSDPMLLPSLSIRVIHVGSLRMIKPEETFDVLVFPSYRGGNTLRWVMSGKGKEAVVISTEGELRAMLRDFREGTEGRNTWMPRRSGPPMPLDDNPEDKLGNVLREVNPALPTLPLDDERFVQGLFDHVPSRKPDAARMTGPVKCQKVMFLNRYAFLPAEGAVTVIKGKGTAEKAVKDLKPGDIVIFINHSQSRTIYDLMLDEIKRSADFEPFVAVIQQWHRRLQSWFMNSGLSYADLHHVLSGKGSEVVGATVASWVRGNTMAPLDPENLSRLISVVGIPDQNGTLCKTLNDAAVRLRKVYKIYGKAVNLFLVKTAGENRAEMDDLLQKYNLDIGSIRDSVEKEEVLTVFPETVSISASIAGRLYGD
jgi:hypothetical protein